VITKFPSHNQQKEQLVKNIFTITADQKYRIRTKGRNDVVVIQSSRQNLPNPKIAVLIWIFLKMAQEMNLLMLSQIKNIAMSSSFLQNRIVTKDITLSIHSIGVPVPSGIPSTIQTPSVIELIENETTKSSSSLLVAQDIR